MVLPSPYLQVTVLHTPGLRQFLEQRCELYARYHPLA